ncbi:MAG: IS21 family transposase [Mariprofundales bacterium]
METIAKVRRDYYAAGKSLKQIARERNLSRNTVRKIIRSDATAFEHKRSKTSEPHTVIGDYSQQIMKWLEEDSQLGRKRRRSAKRIYELLCQEGYDGAYDSIQRFVKQWKEDHGQGRHAGVFIPLSFDPGDAMQFDWSLEHVVINGVPKHVKVGHFRLAHSRKFFIVAFPREQLEMVLEAHNRAIAYFGGCTRRIIYDNPKTIVNRILKGKERDVNKRFARLASHYLFEPVMCNPASGWEKGQVEKQVQDIRNWVFCPKLRFDSMEELNIHLQAECDRLSSRAHPEIAGKTIAEVFATEKSSLISVQRPFEAYTERELKADRTSLVRYDRMHYSVECIAANRCVTLRSYADRIVVLYKDKVIADHLRYFERDEVIYDPWHYIGVLARKPGALRDGAPFKQWDALPASMEQMRHKMAHISGGDKAFVSLLCAAQEHGIDSVAKACQEALNQGIIQAEWVINSIFQTTASSDPIPESVSTDLHLNIEPLADCSRYDALLWMQQGGSNAIH